MAAPIPGVVYTSTPSAPGQWKAPGRPPLTGTSRDLLVPGTYIPGPGTTGPKPGTVLEDINPTSGHTILFNNPDEYVKGKRFWGEVHTRAPGVIFEDCEFMLADPSLPYTQNTEHGAIKAYGPLHYHCTLIDCRITSRPWVTLRGRQSPSPRSMGMHGSDFTMLRCEVTDVQDGTNFVGHGDRYMERYTQIWQSWIHGMFFMNAWEAGPSDKRTHSDVLQWGTGRNYDIQYNMLGGVRDMVGYRTWPGGYNSGDDAWNAVMMIVQQLSNADDARLENIIVNHNWMGGGTAGINHVFMNSRPNDFATMSVTNNIFLPRGSGYAASATGPGTLSSGDGWPILRGVGLASLYNNNTWLNTGLPVKVQGQANV